jgi:4a-hydroxytetrahydrobiopterin dehydratase
MGQVDSPLFRAYNLFMTKLARKTCVPCLGNVPALSGDRIDPLLADLDQWSVEKGHHLTKTFKFRDFAHALAFVNRVGEIAEEQDHHPDVHLSWGRVRLDIWTHKIDGLTENDFILAAKIDELS